MLKEPLNSDHKECLKLCVSTEQQLHHIYSFSQLSHPAIPVLPPVASHCQQQDKNQLQTSVW